MRAHSMPARIIARTGNPLRLPPNDRNAVPPHAAAMLNRLFFEGQVDLGGLVEIDGSTYVCTREGWGAVLP